MALEPGTYLRNNWSLFYFVDFLPNGEGVLLEDCWSNVVSTLSMKEFEAMKLRARLENDPEPVPA